MNILIVADHPFPTSLIRAALTDEQNERAMHVSTVARALHVLDDTSGEFGPFDLIIADNDMQPQGGFGLSREVKHRLRMDKNVPPILLLLARMQDVWLAGWSECDAYAIKPTDPFDLNAVITALVEGNPVPDLPGIGSDSRDLRIDEILAGQELL